MTFWEVVESLRATPDAPGLWWGMLDGGEWGWVRVRAGRHAAGLFAESPHNPNLHSLDLFRWDPSVSPLPYPMDQHGV